MMAINLNIIKQSSLNTIKQSIESRVRKSYKSRPLNAQERAMFKPYFAQIVLDKALIVDGKVPLWLRKNMCAVVLGRIIYFRAGVYQPNTKRGVELLGHELTHVSQFLHGMSLLSYLWSCRKGYFKSAYEVEAYAKGRLIAANFASNFNVK